MQAQNLNRASWSPRGLHNSALWKNSRPIVDIEKRHHLDLILMVCNFAQIQACIGDCNANECTGVQNPHRYMHAYNIAGDVSHGSLCIYYSMPGVFSELHTLHLNGVVVLLN